MTGFAIVSSPRYDHRLCGLQRLHPFDAHRAGRALAALRSRIAGIDALLREPAGPVTDEDLLRVHTPEYLRSLRSSAAIARAIEVPLLRLLPGGLLRRGILTPMRWATQGSIDAVRWALEHGAAANLAGGYHHAHADHGEGFCIFADAAVAVAAARASGALTDHDRIVVIDLDAHRGNGMQAIWHDDPRVAIFDLYNFQAYPGRLRDERYPALIGLRAHVEDEGYLRVLREDLPAFLGQHAGARLAIYNAGTDIVAGDAIGAMSVSEEGVRTRDRFVIDALAASGMSWVLLPSGGYTARSAGLLADGVAHAAGVCGG